MSSTFDTSRFEARIAAARAALRPSLADRLPLAATDLLVRTGYVEPIEPETQGADLDTVITDVTFTSDTAAQVGILQLWDWALTEPHKHCDFCLAQAEGGPYTSDFPDRPEQNLGPHDDKNNPCNCIWAPREPGLAAEASEVLLQLGADVRSDLAAAWRSA